MNFLTSLLTVLFCVTQAGCAPGNIGEATKPKITFELPAEWKYLEGVEVEGVTRRSWSAYLFGPDKNESSIAKFSMVQLHGTNDDAYPGATPKKKAEKYHEVMSRVCSPDWNDCSVEPIQEVEHAGIKAYVFSTNNSGGWSENEWATEFFFLKNNVNFTMEIVDRFEAKITQETYKKVFETLRISY